MADDNSNVETIKRDLAESWRHDIAMQASYEIYAMARLIIHDTKRLDIIGAFDSEFLAFKGIAMRIIDLNNIVMSAINDPVETADDLALRLG